MRFQHCFTVDPISQVEPFSKNRRYSSLLKTCCSSVTSCYPKNSCCKTYLFQLFRAFIGEAWKLERVQCTFPVPSYTDHTKNYWGLGDSRKQTLKYIEGCSYWPPSTHGNQNKSHKQTIKQTNSQINKQEQQKKTTKQHKNKKHKTSTSLCFIGVTI